MMSWRPSRLKRTVAVVSVALNSVQGWTDVSESVPSIVIESILAHGSLPGPHNFEAFGD